MFANKTILEWQNKEESSLWLFERRQSKLTPDEIYSSNFLVAVSLKNPRFSNHWLEVVANDVEHFSGKLYLTLADTPYFESELAQSGSPSNIGHRIEALKKIRDEQHARLSRFAAQRKSVEWLDWRAKARQTPEWLRSEVEYAYSNEGYFFECVVEQVKRVFPNRKLDREAAAFGRFLIDEIPTLIHLYYEVIHKCIDVYPGPQAKLFWLLQNEAFTEEMPLVSHFVKDRGPHTYANVAVLND